jgi:ribosomal protein L37AE/L43A
MLVMQNSTRPAGDPIAAEPACPNCGRSMHLARIAPRPEGDAELRIYRCGECGVSLAESADDRSAPSRMIA